MKIKPGLLIILCLTFVLGLIDFYTTIRLGDLSILLEANPLFHLGGFWLIGLMNIVFMVVLYFVYMRGNPHLNYFLILITLSLAITRLMVIQNNLSIAENPPTLEEAKAISTEVKTTYYVENIIIDILKFSIMYIVYLFFIIDHKVTFKGG